MGEHDTDYRKRHTDKYIIRSSREAWAHGAGGGEWQNTAPPVSNAMEIFAM